MVLNFLELDYLIIEDIDKRHLIGNYAEQIRGRQLFFISANEEHFKQVWHELDAIDKLLRFINIGSLNAYAYIKDEDLKPLDYGLIIEVPINTSLRTFIFDLLDNLSDGYKSNTGRLKRDLQELIFKDVRRQNYQFYKMVKSKNPNYNREQYANFLRNI